MKLYLIAGCVLSLVLALQPNASAQPKDRKRGGTIAGRVVDGTSDKPVKGVTVTLTGGRTEDGETVDRIKKTARTDGKGRFVFRGLPAGEDRFYALDARYDGGFFAGGAVSVQDKDIVRTTLRVWKTTTDPAALLVRRDDMFVVVGDGDVDIVESLTLVNPSERAYIGRADKKERTADTPSFSIPLPDGAFERGVQIAEADIDIPRLVRTDAGVGITVAIPPGQISITLSYQVPGSAGSFDLSRTAQYETTEASVFAESPLVIRSDRLQPGEKVLVGGTEYTRYSTTDVIDAGDAIQVLAVAEADSSSGPFVIGALAVLALLAAVAVLSYRRSRTTTKPATPRRKRPSRVPREELLTAIASLDMDYEAGKITEEQWNLRRDRFKRALGAEPPATSEDLAELPPVDEPPTQAEPAGVDDDVLSPEVETVPDEQPEEAPPTQPLEVETPSSEAEPGATTEMPSTLADPPSDDEPEGEVDPDLPPLETERHHDETYPESIWNEPAERDPEGPGRDR